MKKRCSGIVTVLLLTFGTALSAVGVHFFRLPNHFSMGGASGIAVLLGELTPGVSASPYASVISLLFVAVGFAFLGKSFGWRTIYCSVLFSVMLQLLEWLAPVTAPLTEQKMLELLFASLLPAVSSALLINFGASTGGTEVAALVMKKFTAIDTGKALLCIDVVFTAATFFLFDFETGLYSSLGLFLKATILDSVLEELQRKKAMFIVTEKPEAVLSYIIENIQRSATLWGANGAYSNEPRWVILAVMSRSQSARLLGYLREIDPTVFILSENSSEIYGKGFIAQ